jgi:hypothetical protein
MGKVTLWFDKAGKKAWRAQWTEQIEGKKKSRSKWFPGRRGMPPKEALTFKADHEADAATYGELAFTQTDRARWWRIKKDCAAVKKEPEAVVAEGLDAIRKAVKKSETIETAVELWELDAKKRGLRPPSISAMKGAVKRFAANRSKTKVADITSADLLRSVGDRYDTQISRDTNLGLLLVFFRWCCAAQRGWGRLENFANVKWSEKIQEDHGRITFYSADETAAYLETLPDKLKPAIATGFFTGLRPIEMTRVVVKLAKDEKGNLEGFDEARGVWHIAARWAKTRRYRKLYDLPDCWHYWWLKYRHAMASKGRGELARKNDGKLVPTNYRNLRALCGAARKKAGIPSKDDGVRHSFGTHAFHRSADGLSRGLEWTIALLGHVGDLKTFMTHYDGRVSREEAEAYFLIYPTGAACDVATRRRIIIVTPSSDTQ